MAKERPFLTPALPVFTSRQKARAEIERLTKEFKKKGGRVFYASIRANKLAQSRRISYQNSINRG